MPISGGSYALPSNGFAQPVANVRVTASAGTETLNDIASALTALVNGTGISSSVLGSAKLGGDITAAGKTILTAVDAAAQRTALGLGTAATQATGAFATATHTHIATDISDSTTAGRALLTGANASAQRTSLGLGTAATSNTGDFAASSHNHDGSAITAGTVPIARLPEATAAQYRNNTADLLLSTDQVWSAAGYVTLTDAATIAVDLSAGLNFSVTLGGNRTLGAPSNTKAGQSGSILVYQDGTGGRTLAYNSVYKFAGGAAFTIDATASRLSVLSYLVIDSSNIVITGLAGVR